MKPEETKLLRDKRCITLGTSRPTHECSCFKNTLSQQSMYWQGDQSRYYEIVSQEEASSTVTLSQRSTDTVMFLKDVIEQQ